MPTTVNVAGRGTITFDDNVSDEEIQQIVQKEFPVSGEDVVRSIAEDPSYAQRMSRDDFMEMRRYKEDKPVDFSAKLAEAFGGIGELVSNAFTTAPKFDPQAGPIEKGASLVANIGQGAMVGAGDFGNMFISVLEGYSNDDNSYSRYRLANDLKDTQENRAEYDRIIDSDFESFKGLQTWQQSRKDILGQASMPAMAETISLVAQPPLPGAALLQVAGVGARIGEVGARVAQMGGKGIQAVGKATTAAANAPQRVAGAAVKALTESKEIAGKVEKIIATGSTGLAAFQLGGFSIPGLSTTATTIALGKAVGNALEVAGEVTQKIAEHAGKKAGRLGVFESLANDLSASTAARAIGRVGSVAGADIVAPYVSAAIQGAAEGAIIGGTIGFITDGEEGAAGGMGAGLALGGAGGLAGRGYAQASGMIRQNKIVNDALRGIASLDPQNRANASRLFDQFIKDGNQEAVAEMVDAKNWLSSDVYFSFINNEQAKAMPAADGTSFEGITVFPSAVTGGKPAIYINVDTVKPGTGFHESFHGAMRTALGETFGKKFTEVIDQTFTPEEKVQFAEDYIKRGGTEEGKQKLRDYLAEKQNLPEEIGAEYFREFLQRRENRDLLLRGQRTTDGSLIAATKGAIDYTLSKLGIDYDATGTGYKGMDALASELIKARTDINKSIAQNGKPLAPVPLDKMATPKLADWAKQHGQSDVLLKDPTTGDVIGVKTEEQVNIGRDAANARAAEEIANVPRGTNAPNDAELAIYQKYFPLEQFLKLTFASEAIKSGNVLNGDYFPATAKKGETSVYASRGMTNLDFVPYKIRTTKKNVVVVDYVDLTQLKARFDDIMSRSKILDQWGGDKDAAWQDVMAYTKNLSLGEGVAKPSAELFGPIKRDIINKIYGFVPTKAQVSEGTIKNISSLGTNIAAESGTGKSQIGKPAYEGSRDTRVVSTMRLDRLGRIADTGRQFSFNENGTYGLSQVNFKPAENLGSAKVNNSDEGFRIITKGNKHSLYAPTGERLGIYDTQAVAESVSSKIQNQSTQISVSQPKVVNGIVTAPEFGAFKFTKDIAANFMPADSKVKLDNYAGRTIIALAADRMGVGPAEVGPLSNRKTLSVPTQGGREFMKIFNGGGWAFTDIKTSDRFLSRLRQFADKNGNTIVGITVLNEINHLNNPVGQLAYVETLQAAIEGGAVSKSQADAHIKEISKRIQDSKASSKSLPQSTRDLFASINNLDSLVNAVKNREVNFKSAAWLVNKAQAKTLPISYDEASSKGMSIQQIARGLTDKELLDIPNYSVVALMEVNVNQKPDLNNFHHAYPVTVHGKTIGFLDKFYNLADLSTEPKIRNKAGAVTAQPVQNVMPVMDNIRKTLETQQGIPSDPTQRSKVNFMPSEIKPNRIKDIAAKVGGGNVSGGAKRFGAFMQEMKDKDITVRDVIKSYGITLSSIQRGEQAVDTVKRRWPDAPFEAGSKVRPEDAFAALLGTADGKRYLDAAEQGKFDSVAAEKMIEKFATFGLQNKLLVSLKDAAENFYPKAEEIISAVRSMPASEYSDYVRQNFPGISYGKVGFMSGQLGRGDLPTFDSRQKQLVYGRDVNVTKERLLEQRDRLLKLGINVPKKYKEFAQTLLHHEVWDRLNKSDTEHGEIKNAMLNFMPETRVSGQQGSDTTQIATTVKTYGKAAGLFPKNTRILDVGAGLGIGADEMRKNGHLVDTVEPLSARWASPIPRTFETIDQAKGKYPGIVNFSVLNVVEPALRDQIVDGIGQRLADGGTAYITARTRSDVEAAKNKRPADEAGGFWIKKSSGDVYQKGFSTPELVGYVQTRLGDQFKVRPASGLNGAAIEIKKFMPSVEFSAPEKLPNGQAWSTGNNYRVIQKTGGKYRVYAPVGAMIGITETLEQAKRMIEKKSPAP